MYEALCVPFHIRCGTEVAVEFIGASSQNLRGYRPAAMVMLDWRAPSPSHRTERQHCQICSSPQEGYYSSAEQPGPHCSLLPRCSARGKMIFRWKDRDKSPLTMSPTLLVPPLSQPSCGTAWGHCLL